MYFITMLGSEKRIKSYLSLSLFLSLSQNLEKIQAVSTKMVTSTGLEIQQAT